MFSYKKLFEICVEELLKKVRVWCGCFCLNLVDFQSLEWKKVSWLFKFILKSMGVFVKFMLGLICFVCGNLGVLFEFDYMGFWCQYVVVMVGLYIFSGGIMKMSYVWIFYNDLENFWWICCGCNLCKSDYIFEDGMVFILGIKGRYVLLVRIYK